MFDTTHVLYMAISSAVTVALLILCAKKVKIQSDKNAVLKAAAITTVLLHYSNILVDYLSFGSATVENNHLFMVYPCNVVMWLLVLAAFIEKKEGLLFEILAEFVFWGGLICGCIGIVFNINYANNPSLYDYDILKGLLSHSTMVFGCAYLLVGGYVKIRVFNVVSCALGLCFFLADGAVVNGLFELFNLPSVNSMYLLKPPVESMPWLSSTLMGIIGLCLLFLFLAVYEMRLDKEERWYSKLREKAKELKEKLKGENK